MKIEKKSRWFSRSDICPLLNFELVSSVDSFKNLQQNNSKILFVLLKKYKFF